MPKKKTTNPDKNTLKRPPIVTIMGHVDHGKTSLLDAIRETNVAAGEHGGITQHIGAYQVEVNTKEGKKKITFIDTPGHEAFEKMRARGASVTDIAVIVIDAKDGVMPQTVESIKHAQKSQVTLLIALNKIDLPEANPERVKKQLADKCDVLVEGFGGEVVCIPVSAKTKKGIDNLLEMILLLAQMKGIDADKNSPLDAVIIESRLDKFKGPLATAIIKNGTLKIGDDILAEDVKGRVKALINDKGENLPEAGPGTPVEILGFAKTPPIGSIVKNKFTQNDMPQQNEEQKEMEMKLPELKPKKLNIILKTDASGSLEAIEQSLSNNVEIIDKGVGEISDSDILRGKATGAVVIGFNVKIPGSVKKVAQNEHVLVNSYQVIYLLLEELAEASKDLDKPLLEEKILGKAKILKQFKGGKYNIAGVKVLEGRIAKNDTVKIERGEDEIGRAIIVSMKHAKEDIQKAVKDIECGLVFDATIDFAEGDAIISYRKTS